MYRNYKGRATITGQQSNTFRIKICPIALTLLDFLNHNTGIPKTRVSAPHSIQYIITFSHKITTKGPLKGWGSMGTSGLGSKYLTTK